MDLFGVGIDPVCLVLFVHILRLRQQWRQDIEDCGSNHGSSHQDVNKLKIHICMRGLSLALQAYAYPQQSEPLTLRGALQVVVEPSRDLNIGLSKVVFCHFASFKSYGA